MKKILFTGFEPFGGESINPSWEAVSELPEIYVAGTKELKAGESGNEKICIVKRRMPVVYDKAGQLLEEAIEKERPDVVICVGQAGGRAALTPEYVAINVKDASIADNDGIICSGEPICKDGPAAYFATIPVKRVVEAMKERGVPASVSYTAGTYVCNNIMYHLLRLLELKYPDIKGGFIHIPFSCEQAVKKGGKLPSLPLSVMTEGLIAAACAAAEIQEVKKC